MQGVKDSFCGFAVFTAGSHNKTFAFWLKSNGFHPNHEIATAARGHEVCKKEISPLPDTANLRHHLISPPLTADRPCDRNRLPDSVGEGRR
jgi:hypothetical protein